MPSPVAPTLVGMIAVGALIGAVAAYFIVGKEGAREESSVTIDAIRKVAKVATIDYHGSITERVVEGHSWYEWKSAELFVEIHGTVEGLVNLEKISMEPADGRRSLTIKIPEEAIEIHGPIIDMDKGIQVTTLHDPNVFHRLTDAQRDAAANHAMAKLKQKAIDSGIKQKTMEEAKQVIAHFLAASGVEARFVGS